MVAQIARTIIEPAREGMAKCGHSHLGRNKQRQMIGNAPLA